MANKENNSFMLSIDLQSSLGYIMSRALCHPLRYPVIMNQRLCQKMVMVSWVGGALNALVLAIYTKHLPKCGHKEIEHFFFKVMAILNFSCVDTSAYKLAILVLGVVLLFIPFVIIYSTYTIIFINVYHMNTPKGWNKGLDTCPSHLMVVGLFYSPVIFTYLSPGFSHSPGQDKTVSVFFSIITIMLKPFIYSLKKKDIWGALKKILEKCLFSN